ncbi:hypothetical protein SAMN06264867_102215 [Halorubrum cibi]|uniref:Uncharacterized protein n=2 Tax=Halorubrum cibi TaxID=413815 RepID=A0A521BED3_9EURY|nr:hypothetical protein SAMN06264867_102215 [Halorubrum cibi]
MGTGAFTAAELDGRKANIEVVDDTDGLIGLEAGTSQLVSNDGGANGNELVIDFDVDGPGDGVNPNSKYQVGGLGGIGNLDEVPGNPTLDTTVEDVAIDTDSDIEDYYAFRLLNQSGSDQAIEVEYETNSDFPSEAEVYMVSQYEEGSGDPEQTSSLIASATPDDREASIIYSDDTDYSTDVDSGKDVKISLLVVVDDAETDDDLGGNIVVRAGSHDDFTTADQ